MEIPDWLRTVDRGGSQTASPHAASPAVQGRHDELFVDKTLRHVLAFLEDSMFSESLAARNGLLQKIEPRLKIITVLIFIVALSLQKSIAGISVFSFLVALLVIASQIPPPAFIRKLLPAAVMTLCVAAPAMLNPIVQGDPLLVLFRFEGPINIGPLRVPGELAITEQGLKSALTLLLRVLTSVSFVFLMIMTTRPNTFMKSASSLVPSSLSSVVSMSYRYIFLLVRKIELFIMGLKSRRLSAVKTGGGQRWTASRMGLLFSISMDLSSELSLAMESRGYKEEKLKIQDSRFKIVDVLWLLFTVLFCGVMTWKSLA